MSTILFFFSLAVSFYFAVTLGFRLIREQGAPAITAIKTGWILGFNSLLFVLYVWYLWAGNLLCS